MLATIISQYLQTNRRLVIPQLGALLVKEPNRTVIFSPLLTRDDGVLRALLTAQGMSEIEASGIMDRILFDVRFALENNEKYTLNGVGSFYGDPSGKITFETELIDPPQAPAQNTTPEAKEEQESPSQKIEPTQANEPTLKPQTSEAQAEMTYYEADPDLDGLSYGGKPKKLTKRAVVRGSSQHCKRGVDWWLIIGIAALALAAGAILYGFLRDGAGSNNSIPFTEEYYAE